MKLKCDNLVTSVWIYDIDNYCIHWANSSALNLWEADSLEELCSRDFKSNTSDVVDKTLRDYQAAFKDKKIFTMFWHFSPKNIEKEAFCHMSGFVLEDGRMALMCEAIASEQLSEKLDINAILMLSSYDKNGQFLSGNPPFLQQISHAALHFEDNFVDQILAKEILNSMTNNVFYENDALLKTKAGNRWFHVHVNATKNDHSPESILLQQFDINDRKLGELSLTRDAESDPLTGLLNRRGLSERLSIAIDENREFFIYYIDLDGFKMINDSMGHAAGDFILKSVASRLCEKMPKKGIASRIGGDEFIWVIDKKDILIEQSELANKLISVINKPYIDSESKPLLVSASIGIANYPDDGQNIDKLILKADAAMYLAKSQGKKQWVNYIRGMEDHLQRQSIVARQLYLAIEKQELTLYYQPIVNAESNTIIGFEALIRWHNPILGNVSADETISVAESIAIISDIDSWVISQALNDLSILRNKNHPNVTMAINISAIHFSAKELPLYLLSELKRNNLKPKDIKIELTESTLLKDIDQKENSATRMVEKGLNLSIDDFGTGYSSLEYLHKIPAKIVKIDRSFTARIEENDTTISCIHHLLKSLNFDTVVEGVETEAQSKILLQLGLKIQQGYGLGMPEPLSFYLK